MSTQYRMPKVVSFVNPRTKNPLNLSSDSLIDSVTGEFVAKLVNGIPRFVKPTENYAESFGWQWKKWEHNQSEDRGASVKQQKLIEDRTHFNQYELKGKVLLECGMGGGDDTEALIRWPFAEVHSFDLSTSVERAHKFLKDPRLFISQASIYSIPYPDESFDFVFCHRVLQHTPDPEKSLRSICKKVRPDGILFIHSYKRSKKQMQEWRYKYRWLTTRIPKGLIFMYVSYLGNFMHRVNNFLYNRGSYWREFAYRFVPFYRTTQSSTYISTMRRKEIIEFEKMITFDALTPKFDSPMSTADLRSILADEGFIVEYLEDSLSSPVYATARRALKKTAE